MRTIKEIVEEYEKLLAENYNLHQTENRILQIQNKFIIELLLDIRELNLSRLVGK